MNKIKRHWYLLLFITIILVSFFLRFYRYDERISFGPDQISFALVARHALVSGQIPILGPFSSTGPFQHGGQWYWFIMLGSAINQQWLILPWIILTLTHVIFVLLIMLFGRELIDKSFSLIVGFFASISTAQVIQGTNLTSHTLIPLFALLAIWAMVRYIRGREY